MKALLLKVLGLVLAIGAGVYFVLYAHRALAGKHLSTLLNGSTLLALLGLIALYALLIPTTVVAWKWLLRTMQQSAGYTRLLAIMATTQFGKYLPGNVAQHIGRVALARQLDIPLSALLFSMAYEMLLMLVACSHVSAITLLWAPPGSMAHWSIMQYRLPLFVAVTLGAAVALMLAPRIAAWLARYRARKRGDADYTAPQLRLTPAAVLGCYLIYALNFCLVGIGLWLVAHALLDGTAPTPSLVFLTGAFASSWILGFLAPGAPAGLGVREAILSAWLADRLPPAQIVLLVVALRIATTTGDLLNFTWGSALMARLRLREHATN
ncbi:lysylphosphatidylglycerol synthase domain-containing protein [Oleiagrimonas sp. C23AA]|uniref:lysylphosphatidylglycerol synthase domain-containing protein n=1 Tax=Oleiagrimonas sp. C23AA TaxID=2719047 RepID=UPI0014215808|nr:lysylphosphatidylglycerol synthase domain-containing protein [Oleiagrimonas sp. C23AA]NII12132.1 hypothetical protein [Oleiagrimonas sp. C23AA]